MARHAAQKARASVAQKPTGPALRAPRRATTIEPLPIQAKLEVHDADDAFEKEADQVADHVMRSPGVEGGPLAAPPPAAPKLRVQREAEGGEADLADALEAEEEPDVAAPPEIVPSPSPAPAEAAGPVQTKPDDAAEPANELADSLEEDSRVQMRADVGAAAPAPLDASDEDVQREMDDEEVPLESMDPGPVQRAADTSGDDDEAGGKDEVQAAGRRRRDPRTPPASFQTALRQAKQLGGRELPRELRTFMEARFGQSFQGVQVHTDERAHGLTRQVRARAFTTGAHLFFKRGEFRPSSPSGRRLIAHELTHVVQQGTGMRMGAVQRQVVQRDAEPSTRAEFDSEAQWTSTTSLRRFFGMRDQDVPKAHLDRITEMLDKALLREPWKLDALVDPDATEACVTTELRAGEHKLTLAARRNSGLTVATFKLEKGPDSNLHLVIEGEQPHFVGAEIEVHAEASYRVDLGELANADRHEGTAESIEAPEPAGPSEAAEEPVAEPAETSPSGPSVTETSAREPSELTENVKAAEAQTEAEREQVAEEPEIDPSAGAGQEAGEDAPNEVRVPIDEETAPEVPTEEAVDLGQASEAGGRAETVQREPDRGQAEPRASAPSWAGRAVDAARRVGGHPIAVAARRGFEGRFGASFSDVRVHTDRRANRLARALRATAFTVGRDIFFAYGRYAPDSPEGRRLLIHELTHVLQQRRGLAEDDALQRHGDEACPPPDPVPEVEVVPSPQSSAEDPAFTEMTTRAENRAENQSRHESGEKKSVEANSAAEVKPGEVESLAQAGQVQKIAAEAAKPPGFDKEGFIQAVLTEVAKVAPQTLDDADKFVMRGKGKAVKSAVTKNAKSATDGSTEPLNQANEQAPDAGAVERRQPTPLEVEPAGAEPGSIRADRAMPPARTRSEVDISAGAIKANNILKEKCITREYLDSYSDPELKGAAAAQDALEENAEQAPAAFREEEASVLEGARGEASSTGKSGVAAMFGDRGKEFAAVGKQQEQAKSDNEKKRDEAAKAVDQIFTGTKTKVDARLAKIDTDASTKFDQEANAAVGRYEQDARRRLDAYKAERYSGRPDLWIRDLFLPLPPEVNAIYRAARDAFLADMRTVIGNVADVVATGLEEARKLVDQGKEEVKTKLDSLGAGLEDFKAQVTGDMNAKFADLSRQVDAKEKSVVTALAKQYAAALEKVSAAEQRLRDENKSLSEHGEDAMRQAVDLVAGEVAKLAALVGEAATRIALDPLTFLKNLGAGIMGGFQMFADNIGTNIKAAVVEWLTGNLAGGGIQLPATFDLKGIVGFLLDVVGLGFAGVKAIASKVFGPQAIALIEQGVAGAEKIKEIFDLLGAEGPAGLLKYLQSEFAAMKEKVLGEVGAALAESLVVAGIKKVVGLLSGLVTGGAGTVVTIVLTIIDVILWVKNNAAQLAELVSTVAGMAMAVLNGNVGAVASAVNTVLKRLLPVVLGFLGSLIGVGGAIDKIRKIFKSVAEPARKAIYGLFLKLKKFVKGLLKKFKGKGKKGKDKKKGGEKYDGEIGERLTFSAGGESHSIWVNASGGKPVVMMASSPKPLKDQLAPLQRRKDDLAKTDPAKAARAGELIATALAQGDTVAKLAAETKTAPEATRAQKDTETEKAEAQLRGTLQSLLDVLGIAKPKELTPPVVLTFKYPKKLPSSPTEADKFAGFTKDGFERQLQGQENGLNALKVGQWRTNRDKYIERASGGDSGRDPIAAGLQDAFRKKQRGYLLDALTVEKAERDFSGMSPAAAAFVRANAPPEGMSKGDAGALVDSWLETQAALHDPDQVAGGYPNGLKDLGSIRINSSLGSQWGNTQAANLDREIDSRLQTVPRPLWNDIPMRDPSGGGAGGIRLKV